MTYLDGRSGLLARRIDGGLGARRARRPAVRRRLLLGDGPRCSTARVRRPAAPRRRPSPTPRSSPWTSRAGTATGPPHASNLVARASATTHPPSLADHYVAYRAHVRAKVACLRRAAGGRVPGAEARRLHALVPPPPGARPRPPRAGGRSAREPGSPRSPRASPSGRGWTVLRWTRSASARRSGPRDHRDDAPYSEGRYSTRAARQSTRPSSRTPGGGWGSGSR